MITKAEGNEKTKICSNCKRYDGMGCYTDGVWNKLRYKYTNPQDKCVEPKRFKQKNGDNE